MSVCGLIWACVVCVCGGVFVWHVLCVFVVGCVHGGCVADIMGGRKLEPNNNGARCTSIWKCSLVVLDMGLRKGDLGEVGAK